MVVFFPAIDSWMKHHDEMHLCATESSVTFQEEKRRFSELPELPSKAQTKSSIRTAHL
jgi:hypothetical protein